MVLQRRQDNEKIPQYSLTGDLLSFLRCGLQYRYHNGSALPPSRPVQLWFGEFIHGIMEGAFRIWRDAKTRTVFPWPMTVTPYRNTPSSGRVAHDIGVIGDTVEASLKTQGKNPRSSVVRESAYLRAEKAVNELGPDLFPLIAAAEERVIGTRKISPTPVAQSRTQLYELHGIIDVLTDVEFNGASNTNIFKRVIQESNPEISGRFEIIVDYKGSRRPAIDHDFWNQGDWQIQTYAWLRTRQPGSLPVVAGILIYINELAPSAEDLKKLKKEVSRSLTDVVPPNGSSDYYELNTWTPNADVPNFSFDYRFARAVRVIRIDQDSQSAATEQFDNVVQRIEQCVDREAAHGRIMEHWQACGDEDSCAACDFRHFCPNPAPRASSSASRILTAPTAP